MATPLGTAGFQTLPNEAAAIASINGAVQNSGMFIFPMPAADGTPGRQAHRRDCWSSIDRGWPN
jgi:hypothetical protein